MRTLDRYILGSLVRTFLFVVFALVVFFVVIDWLTSRRIDMVDFRVGWIVIGEYYLARVPQLLIGRNLVSLSALLAVLTVFGLAAQRNEILAANAGGVSLFRIALFPAIFAFLLSLALFYMSESIGLQAARRALAIESEYFGERSYGIHEGRPPMSWSDLDGGWTCHITKFNPIARTGEEILLMSQDNGLHEQIRANRIFWDPDTRRWMLEDGIWTVFFPEQGMANQSRRITLEPAPIAESPEVLLAPLTRPELLGIEALTTLIEDGRRRGIPVRRFQVDYHARFAQSAFPFVMIWLGIPLAARFRRGGRIAGVGVGVALGLFYLLSFTASVALGHAGRLDPIPAAWLPNWIFLLTGIGLFGRTPT